MSRKNVFSIPPGVDFLPAFVEALLAGGIVPGFPGKFDPFSLSAARIYVPTRRAARALTAEIARQLDRPAILLPQIVPLGSMGEAETEAMFAADAPIFGRPDVVGEVERRLVLAELILEWSRKIRQAIQYVDGGRMVTVPDEMILVTASPVQAWHLAADLASLIDEFVIENIDANLLRTLAPDRFDRYWSITLDFLKIALEAWPNHLAERGLEDRAQRQAALVDAEIARLGAARDTAAAPHIVIGSTGTNAATARLIAAIAALPNGAVVLPGLDKGLDAQAWDAIAGEGEERREPAAGHPQTALRRLLGTIGIMREDVEEIGAPGEARQLRMNFIREAMRPAEATERWHEWRAQAGEDTIVRALAGIAFVEAEDERSEALAIAIALRKSLTDSGATAALVTPDRTLARRVRAELQRWDVEVDDSGGDQLSQQPAGILARLVIACAEANPTTAHLLALIDHAHVRLGLPGEEFGRLRPLAEIGLLRTAGFRLDDPPQSLVFAREAADDVHAHRFRKQIAADDWRALEDFATRLRDGLAPLRTIEGEQPIQTWFAAHRASIAKIAATPGTELLWPAGEDYLALHEVFESFLSSRTGNFRIGLEGYAAIFAAAAQETIVRGPRRAHPRIKILGLLEARLLSADLVILAGLDEATWPPSANTDAFLNRPMRAELGLSPPERRIGQTAHDFVEAMGAREVILTRAKKRSGSPTVASRFIQRMAALAGPAWKACADKGGALLHLAALLDSPVPDTAPLRRPEPRPKLHLRPQSLSVTQIETWRRDPYAIYARHILGLEPLESLDPETTPADLGTGLHETLSTFHKRHPQGPLPADGADELIQIASDIFAGELTNADFRLFVWPRYEAFFRNFVTWDNQRRAGGATILTELSGKLEIPLEDGSGFTLRARGDRFEIGPLDLVSIIDFKSGSPPSRKQVAVGIAPQLTLEAAMLDRGAFAHSLPAAAKTGEALYLRIGQRDELKEVPATKEDIDLRQMALEHYEGLRQLALQFRDEATPYLSRPVPQFQSRYGDYDHLARVREWSSPGGEGGET